MLSFLTCIPRSAQLSLAVCMAYGTISMSLALVNKFILSSYNFDCVFLLLLAQLCISFVFCTVSRDKLGNPFNIPVLTKESLRAALPMGFCYVMNVGVGLVGLKLVNIPMFFCIRRLVAPTILAYEYLALGKVADTGIQAAVYIILLGTITAGWDSLNSDIMGYVVTMVNNGFSAAAQVLQKQFSETYKPSTFGIVYYNACVAAPLTLVLAIITGELPRAAEFPHYGDPSFWGGFLVASVMGLALTYSSMLCTTYNSPLATSITGNVKDIATTAIGWVLFQGFVATPKALLGLGMSFCGAFLYSWVNLQKQLANKAATALKLGSGSSSNSSNNGATATSVATSSGSETPSLSLQLAAGAGASSSGTASAAPSRMRHTAAASASAGSDDDGSSASSEDDHDV